MQGTFFQETWRRLRRSSNFELGGSVATCRSEFCYVPADGPHFPLSHDHLDKWATAMVSYKPLWLVYTFMSLYSSMNMKGPHLLRLNIHQIFVNLIQFRAMPLSLDLCFCKLVWKPWKKRRDRKLQAQLWMLFFLPTMDSHLQWLHCWTLWPIPASSLHSTWKGRRWISLLSVTYMDCLKRFTSGSMRTQLRVLMRLFTWHLLILSRWDSKLVRL